MDLFTKHKQTHRDKKETNDYQRRKKVGPCSIELEIDRI